MVTKHGHWLLKTTLTSYQLTSLRNLRKYYQDLVLVLQPLKSLD